MARSIGTWPQIDKHATIDGIISDHMKNIQSTSFGRQPIICVRKRGCPYPFFTSELRRFKYCLCVSYAFSISLIKFYCTPLHSSYKLCSWRNIRIRSPKWEKHQDLMNSAWFAILVYIPRDDYIIELLVYINIWIFFTHNQALSDYTSVVLVFQVIAFL